MIVWSLRPTWWRTSATRTELVHHGQARDVAESLGQGVGRRARPRRRRPSRARRGPTAGVGDGVLLGSAGAPTWRRTRARTGAVPGERRRAAVDLLEQPALVEDLEVAPDGHVGDAEVADEVGDADRPRPRGRDRRIERLALSGEHQSDHA